MRVRVKDFLESCTGFLSALPEDFIDECTRLEFDAALHGGVAEVDVPGSVLDRLTAAKDRQKRYDEEYSAISEHRVAGMSAEDAGDLGKAVQEYAESIRLGMAGEFGLLHAYYHSFRRVIVVLGKLKRYADECEFIEKFLTLELDERDRASMCSRLEKTRVKLQKSKS